jgi:hypothetical protein
MAARTRFISNQDWLFDDGSDRSKFEWNELADFRKFEESIRTHPIGQPLELNGITYRLNETIKQGETTYHILESSLGVFTLVIERRKTRTFSYSTKGDVGIFGWKRGAKKELLEIIHKCFK